MREPVGVILAGGRGMRMGGTSKGDLTLGDARLLDLCIDRLSPQVSDVAVNANTEIKTDLPVIADTVDGHLGPLSGILAGMDWALSQGHDHIVTVAVDTPFFPCDLVPRFLMAGDFAIAATKDGAHATFGLWPVTLRTELAGFLDAGGRKVRAFTEAHGAVQVMFQDSVPSPFFNINTPEDLAQACAWV